MQTLSLHTLKHTLVMRLKIPYLKPTAQQSQYAAVPTGYKKSGTFSTSRALYKQEILSHQTQVCFIRTPFRFEHNSCLSLNLIRD